MKRAAVALAVGGLLCLAIGLIAGFRPVTRTTSPAIASTLLGAYSSCGSVLDPHDAASHHSFVVTQSYRRLPSHFALQPCSDARRQDLVLTIVMWSVGVLLLGGALVTFRRGTPSPYSPAPLPDPGPSS